MASIKEIQKDPEDAYCVTLDSEHPDVRYIASRLPGFDFKGVPAFFDIGGIFHDIKVFEKVVHLFVERYKTKNLSSIAGFDSRGFLFGPSIAQALGIPFFMLRKKGKLPGITMEQDYGTEYSKDSLCIACNAVRKGDRVLLVDDLVATGGTLIAGASLIYNLGGVVAECALVCGIDGLKGWRNLHNPVDFFTRLGEGCAKNEEKEAWLLEAKKAKESRLGEALKCVPVFLMVDVCKAPSMPVGSTSTYTVLAGSPEAQQIQKALVNAPRGAVPVKNADGSYSCAVPGADGKFNEAYLASEA